MSSEYYNAMVVKIVAGGSQVIKYLTYADVLNGLTKPHLFIVTGDEDTVEQIDYSKLLQGHYYIVVCLKVGDVWYWEYITDITDLIQ